MIDSCWSGGSLQREGAPPEIQMVFLICKKLSKKEFFFLEDEVILESLNCQK
jgi:hypothetical protein